MSAGYDSTSPHFFRPADVARIRRNQRRIHLQRIASAGGKAALAIGTVVGSILLFQHTQGDSRFAVKSIEITGARYTPRPEIDAVTRQYRGMNLFKLDIASVRRDLRGLGWIKRIEAEKKLPDTLRIRIVERVPAALVATGGGFTYVDDDGVAFAALSPTVGDSDLPLITNAAGVDLQRCVALLQDLRARDPEVYSRVSEVRPAGPGGFALFDRELGAFVYTGDAGLSAKWRELYSIARADKFGAHGIEYADLRFAGRIVIKPFQAPVLAPLTFKTSVSTPITN